MNWPETDVLGHQIAVLWEYIEQLLALYQVEDNVIEMEERTWLRRTVASAQGDCNNEQVAWFWKMVRWLMSYLFKKGMIHEKCYCKDYTNVECVTSMLDEYGWIYQNGYIYDKDDCFPYNAKGQEWIDYISVLVEGNDSKFIMESVIAYYANLCWFDENNPVMDEYCLDDLNVRYILVKKHVGEITAVKRELLIEYAEKLICMHNYAIEVIANIEDGNLMVCIVVPSIFTTVNWADVVWGDSYIEPFIGVVLALLERILRLPDEVAMQ